MVVKAWMAGTVDGGDKNGGKEIMSGITVKLLLNHCPNYVRNHWRITCRIGMIVFRRSGARD